MRQHLVLLGDSILDNAAYVPGRCPAVIDQLRSRLPTGWFATLLARDGSVIDDVYRQLDALPGDATHLVLSAGGNDALSEVGTLQKTVMTVGQGLRVLAEVCDRFEGDYRRLLASIRDRGLPAGVCTVYNPSLPDEVTRREVVAALGLFNDCIIRGAREFKFPVLELRAICTDAADFVAQIEPSLRGGAKIAEAICQNFVGHDFGTRQTVIFP
jgi:GDSL-like Lipase/Acylhydrolase family